MRAFFGYLFRYARTLLVLTAFALLFSPRVFAGGDYGFESSDGSATWQDGPGGSTWFDFGSFTPNVNWDNSLQNIAEFHNTGPLDVSVNGTVSANLVYFGGADVTLNGGTIVKNANIDQGDLAFWNGTNSTATINSDVQLDTSAATTDFDFLNNGSGTIALGNITFVASGTPYTKTETLKFTTSTAGAASKFILNGTFSSGATGVQCDLVLGDGASDQATYYFNGDYSNVAAIAINQGTMVLGTSKTGSSLITASPATYGADDNTTIVTSGAQTIANRFLLNAETSLNKYITVGGSTADDSTYTGMIEMSMTDIYVTAVDGGRVNFTNFIEGDMVDGVVKIGAGTVVLSQANPYTVKPGPVSMAADIRQGTLLINNTSGSAFGYYPVGEVKVEAGAKLGGIGISTQKVVTADKTSVIAPGDSGADGGTVGVGVLHLTGGLDTTNGGLNLLNPGATFDFKINGAASSPTSFDQIDLGASNFSAEGTLTFNFTNLGGLQPGEFYEIMFGTGSWNDANANFVFNGPAGYNVSAYTFNAGGNSQLKVEFTVPEPSTYALILGSLVALMLICPRQRTCR
jgi:hypothetical protein